MRKIVLLGLIILLGLIFVAFFLSRKKVNPIVHMPTVNPITLPSLIEPKPDANIAGPLVIKGIVPKSFTFEGQFQMKLLDDQRKVIIQDRVPVEMDKDGKKTEFNFIQSYNYHTTAKWGYLVLENDNPSGLPENQKSIETRINKFIPPFPGRVYLYNQLSKIPGIDDLCEVVLPQFVDIPITQTPIKDTFNLLAKSMHSDFYVKSLNLKNGLLTIEFPDIPGFTTGGSCAQSLHRTMVEKTALQFPEVKEVKIIPESIFQP